MDKRPTGQAPRVVRTTKPTNGKRPKKPVPAGVRAAKTVGKSVLKVFLIVMLVITITCCIVGTVLTVYVMDYINSDPVINLSDLKLNFVSTVYGLDNEGEYQQVQTLRRGENRVWIDLKDIPQHVQDVFVYSEDERFWTHSGIDFKRTIAAFVNEVMLQLKLTNKRFGGSTITQQLIKNIDGDLYDRGITTKIQELLKAMNLDRHYTKDQILEMYLNYVGLGNNISGVQAASRYYFGKDVSEIDYVEAAALAVTTKSPVNLNPKDGPAENKVRRNQVGIDKLLEFNCITQDEYDAGIKRDLVLRDTSKPLDENETTINRQMQSYYVDAVIEEVVADLAEKFNYSKDYAEQVLYTSGYQVYSNMEISTQSILETFFENPETFETPQLGDKEAPQASMVISDLNGNIRALVGGMGEKVEARGFNRATMSPRPAGSTIKPLGVYAPAFENNLITWSSIMPDEPVTTIIDSDTGQERGYPRNYNKVYEGDMTIIEAIKVSKNTIPFMLCQMITPQVCFDFVYQELGIKSLVATGPNNNINEASLALGDGGVYLTDLTAAYQIFGNGGNFTAPKLYSKVTDAEGKVILDTTTRQTRQVLSTDTTYVMNKALWRVVNEEGGSGRAGRLENFETIGKTGTSNDRKDLLFMGITPYYVAGIRYGYDDNNLIIPGAQSFQIPVWQKIMTAVHAGKEPAQFNLSDENVIELGYCTISGMLATVDCPGQKLGFYKINDTPSSCTVHGAGAIFGEADDTVSGAEDASSVGEDLTQE